MWVIKYSGMKALLNFERDWKILPLPIRRILSTAGEDLTGIAAEMVYRGATEVILLMW